MHGFFFSLINWEMRHLFKKLSICSSTGQVKLQEQWHTIVWDDDKESAFENPV